MMKKRGQRLAREEGEERRLRKGRRSGEEWVREREREERREVIINVPERMYKSNNVKV